MLAVVALRTRQGTRRPPPQASRVLNADKSKVALRRLAHETIGAPEQY